MAAPGTDSPFSLKNRVGIVLGLANQQSIAYGCARAFNALGAEQIVTYASEKAERHVSPLAPDLGDPELRLCDVQDPDSVQALFDRARERWGRVDFVVHSVAFAPLEDLHGRLVDSSIEGFNLAMDVSCHSFVRLARAAEPLMSDGGSLLCMSYDGANRVIPNYSLMGPVKAALESATRYLAAELGPAGVRVNAVSPGPIHTRAASGLKDFDELAEKAASRSPLRRLASIDDVGHTAAWLVSDAGAGVTAGVHYVDAGDHVIG